MNKLINHLILLGIVLSPFTQLRLNAIEPVGPSELLLLISTLLIIIQNKGRFYIHKNIYNIFWIVFIISVLFFSLINWFTQGSISFANIREFATYIFIFFIILGLFNHFYRQKIEVLERLVLRLYFLSSILLVLLYIYSFVSPVVFGYDLYFGTRLSLLAENPHQLSVYSGVILLLGFKYFDVKVHSIKNIILIINSVFLLLIGVSTISASFYASIIAALLFLLVFIVIDLINNNRFINYLTLSIFSFLTFILLSFVAYWPELIYKFFESDENGLGRIFLWKEAIKYSIDNYLLGYGLGTVIEIDSHLIETSEAHNLVLDVLIKGGIFPVIILFIMMIYTFVKFFPYKIYSSILVFISMYSIAGFSLRRMIFWFIIIICIVIINKREEGNK